MQQGQRQQSDCAHSERTIIGIGSPGYNNSQRSGGNKCCLCILWVLDFQSCG